MKSPSSRLLQMFRKAAVEGLPRDTIAREYNIQRSTLDRNIRRVERYLATQVLIVESQVVGHVHIQRLEVQWEQLMDAWRKSKQEQVVSKASTDKDGNRRAEVTRRTSTGDPRYLEQARRVLSDMRGLLGIEQFTGDAEEWPHVSTATIIERFEEVDRLLAKNGKPGRTEANVRTDPRPADDLTRDRNGPSAARDAA